MDKKNLKKILTVADPSPRRLRGRTIQRAGEYSNSAIIIDDTDSEEELQATDIKPKVIKEMIIYDTIVEDESVEEERQASAIVGDQNNSIHDFDYWNSHHERTYQELTTQRNHGTNSLRLMQGLIHQFSN